MVSGLISDCITVFPMICMKLVMEIPTNIKFQKNSQTKNVFVLHVEKPGR